MLNILKVVAIHLGICWQATLTDTPLLLLLLFQATVLVLTHSSMACYMPLFHPFDPVWFLEAGKCFDPCILLVLLLVESDFWSACSYCLVLPKTHASDNPPPRFSPARSFLVTQIIPCPHPVFVTPSFQAMSSGKSNMLTGLDLRCGTTLGVGVFSFKKS